MRTLPEIDRDIDAIHEEVRRRHPELRQESEIWDGPSYDEVFIRWQAGWDAEPELRERHEALILERGDAQQERDRVAYEAITAARRSNAAKRAARTRKARAAAR